MLRRYIKPYLHLIAILLALAGPAKAGENERQPERWYQDKWCFENGGRVEIALEDQTRCDCVTATHAVEIEFAERWHHAIGQSLHYSLKTGKKAGIALILHRGNDRKYFLRLKAVIERFKLPIRIWLISDEKSLVNNRD
ncbi:MAG: hypothetical protein JRF53_00450 [Deltaproteobacteria bacterium]|nr:hypothetical protein [Deltaproteobacteria bacterium]